MKQSNLRRLRLLTAIALLFAGVQALALPQDREQPIRVQANKLEANRGKNLSIYSGDVEITQGSLQIRADRVEVYGNEAGEITRVIAIGRPAHFQQQVEQAQNPVKARAQRIEFTVSTDKLHLIGDAQVDRDGNTLTAEKIDYDLNREEIQAQSESDNGRVEMIWKPENKKDNGRETDESQHDE